jgi:hypothetical protein
VLSDCYVGEYYRITQLNLRGNIIALGYPGIPSSRSDGGEYSFNNYGKNLYITIFKNEELLPSEMFEQEGFVLLKHGGNVEVEYSDSLIIESVDTFSELYLIYDSGESNLMETIIEFNLVENKDENLGYGDFGISFEMAESGVWYNKLYYDYIIGFEEPLFPLRSQSAMDPNMFNDQGEAISHIILIAPKDAEFFARLCNQELLTQALWAVIDFLREVVLDLDGIEKVYDDATIIFLKAMDMEEGDVDWFTLAKEFLMKAFSLEELGKKIKPIELAAHLAAAMPMLLQDIIRLSQWKEILMDNAANGQGTTIVFSYSRYGVKHKHCDLYKYGYNDLSTWGDQASIFHSPKISKNEHIEGYVNYSQSNLIDCFVDACNYPIINVVPANTYFF